MVYFMLISIFHRALDDSGFLFFSYGGIMMKDYLVLGLWIAVVIILSVATAGISIKILDNGNHDECIVLGGVLIRLENKQEICIEQNKWVIIKLPKEIK